MQTGQKIALLRKQAGFSQQELADRLFVSRELVSKWETGKRYPDSAALSQLSKLFEKDIQPQNSGLLYELADCIPEELSLSPQQLTIFINDYLEALTKTERMIFISRYYHRQQSSQTAEITGLSQSNVRKKLMLIKQGLTEFIKENCNEDQ